MNEIEEFIHRRFPKAENWMTGNCFWFAEILKKRFPKLHICYLPVEGHFITMLVKKSEKPEYYDQRGRIEPQEIPMLLSWIKTKDPAWYSRLIRDCWM